MYVCRLSVCALVRSGVIVYVSVLGISWFILLNTCACWYVLVRLDASCYVLVLVLTLMLWHVLFCVGIHSGASWYIVVRTGACWYVVVRLDAPFYVLVCLGNFSYTRGMS